MTKTCAEPTSSPSRLQRLGCERIFTLSGNHIMSIFDAVARDEDRARPRAPRSGRGAHGRCLGTADRRARDRAGYRRAGPRQCGRRAIHRAGAESADGAPVGPRRDMGTRPRRLPGNQAGGHGRARHQGVLDGEVGRNSRPATSARPSDGDVGTAGAGACQPAVGLARRKRVNSITIVMARTGRAAGRAEHRAGDCGWRPGRHRLRQAAGHFCAARTFGVAGRALLKRLEEATNVPVVIIESPRGLADATLGAFADLVRRADLDRAVGQGTRFHDPLGGRAGLSRRTCALIVDRSGRSDGGAGRKGGRCPASHRLRRGRKSAAKTLIARASGANRRSAEWLKEARAALDNRPAEWASVVSRTEGRLHPAEVFRVLRPYHRARQGYSAGRRRR